jgi:hypothetical protein
VSRAGSSAAAALGRAAVIALGLALGGAPLAAGCGPRPPAVRPEAQGLRLDCPLDDALVLVDGRPVGTAASVRRRELPILPGVHRVEVQADRYFTRYLDVEVPPGGRIRLEVTLRPRPEVP